MGRIRNKTENTPLAKYGVESVFTVKTDTCKANNLVIVHKEDSKGTHYTFFKKDGQWHYHPPGEPKNHIPCTKAEADYLEQLLREGEREYAKKQGLCSGGRNLPPIPPPPPVGGKNRQAC
jgi:hypothetical protein